VTGSQGWLPEHGQVNRVLCAVCSLAPGAVLVSGACSRGADRLCEAVWASYGCGDQIERHRARWDLHGGGAGFIRSEEMVHLGASLCVAFILPCTRPGCLGHSPDRGLAYHGTHGSVHCADYAEDHGIPTRRFPPVRLSGVLSALGQRGPRRPGFAG
jgi:hypothetical protein